MTIPALGSRSLRLVHLSNSVSSSPTFQKLVGASDAASALDSVFIDWVGDNDLDSDNFAPFPRCVLRHVGPQIAQREGTDTFLGTGQMSIYVQYEQFTAAQLAAWYSITGNPTFTDADYRQHMNNLYGLISDDLMIVAAQAGCLEVQRIEEFSCGFLDPVTENGKKLVELCYVVHREGLP